MTSLVIFLSFATAVVLCAAILLTRPWHAHITGRREDNACHELHDGMVPRLGGAAIFLAGLFALTALSHAMSDATARLLWSLWACLSVVAAIGMYEDFMRNLPPLLRYFGTAVAALMFSVANGGIGIESVAIMPIDALLQYSFFSVLFFAFAVTGVTHAFNLIDGQHGLSAGMAIIALSGLALVAQSTGQMPLATLAAVLAAANLGFVLFNYPLGRIFLGDCGAYFNGAAIGALAVLVVEGSPLVSPWFALTLLIYPVWETLFSMWRRLRRGESLFLPDVSHLHHLYFQRDRQQGHWLRQSSAPRLLGLALLPALAAVVWHENTAALMLVAAGFIVTYSWIYSELTAQQSQELGQTQL